MDEEDDEDPEGLLIELKDTVARVAALEHYLDLLENDERVLELEHTTRDGAFEALRENAEN